MEKRPETPAALRQRRTPTSPGFPSSAPSATSRPDDRQPLQLKTRPHTQFLGAQEEGPRLLITSLLGDASPGPRRETARRGRGGLRPSPARGCVWGVNPRDCALRRGEACIGAGPQGRGRGGGRGPWKLPSPCPPARAERRGTPEAPSSLSCCVLPLTPHTCLLGSAGARDSGVLPHGDHSLQGAKYKTNSHASKYFIARCPKRCEGEVAGLVTGGLGLGLGWARPLPRALNCRQESGGARGLNALG